jgi:hypothetical protein
LQYVIIEVFLGTPHALVIKQEDDMKILLIDDQRDIKANRVARNYDQGIAALKSEKWDILYLDHDLGDFSYGDDKEKTGYDIMLFLEEFQEYLPGKIEIVSSNPVGRNKMQTVINKLYEGK